VEEFKKRIDEVAALMEEFRLSEAELESDGRRVAFKKRRAAVPAPAESDGSLPAGEIIVEEAPPVAVVEQRPLGTPVSSPMTGIYYGSPSPNAPAFVKEGELVTAGQVVALIEAMKVFNEITAPVSGLVSKLLAENGQLVQPGDPLLYVG
jgi:acetyl-CoA carboxylase biotin carboxyl carrier protein